MNTPKLVVFGYGGTTIYRSKSETQSSFGITEERQDIPDGTPALDLRPGIENKEKGGFGWVFRGPMVDVDLPDWTSDSCPNASGVMELAMEGNEYGTLLQMQKAQRNVGERSGLDRVSTIEYIRGWLDHGARLGHYYGGKIVWEDKDNRVRYYVVMEDGYVKVKRRKKGKEETICAGIPVTVANDTRRITDISFVRDMFRKNNMVRRRAMDALVAAGWR